MFLHETAESWQVSWDWRYPHDCALSWQDRTSEDRSAHQHIIVQTVWACDHCTWCVAPRLIVRGEDAKMAASYKFLVIHRKQRRCGWKKLRMEDDLTSTNVFIRTQSYLLLQTKILEHHTMHLEVVLLYLSTSKLINNKYQVDEDETINWLTIPWHDRQSCWKGQCDGHSWGWGRCCLPACYECRLEAGTASESQRWPASLWWSPLCPASLTHLEAAHYKK